jgi:hypothetical protein
MAVRRRSMAGIVGGILFDGVENGGGISFKIPR